MSRPEMDNGVSVVQRVDLVLSGVQVWLRGMSGAGGMTAAEQLVSEFVVASRLLAAGLAESALRVLLPAQQPLAARLPVMVTVGAIVTGAACYTDPAADPVAGAQPGQAAVRDLIAAERGEHVLIDALAGLLVQYAAWEATR